MLRLSMLAALLCTSLPAFAAPAQPTGKWKVEYTATSCTAARTYPGFELMIEPAPLGRTTRYTLAFAGKPTEALQLETRIRPADSGPPITTTSLHFPMFGQAWLRTVLTNEQAARLAASSGFKLETKGRRKRFSNSSVARPDDQRLTKTFEIALSSMPALAKALDSCIADLRKEWGMVNGELPEPAKKAEALRPLSSLFTADDYPTDAMVANQKGSVTLMIMIDAAGQVVDCVPVESSGVASIDAMSCNIVVGRARYRPALDAAGSPVRSIRQATIVWDIRG